MLGNTSIGMIKKSSLIQFTLIFIFTCRSVILETFLRVCTTPVLLIKIKVPGFVKFQIKGAEYGAVTALGINMECTRLLCGHARGQVSFRK